MPEANIVKSAEAKMKSDSSYSLTAEPAAKRQRAEVAPAAEAATPLQTAVDKGTLPMADAAVIFHPMSDATCILFDDGRLAIVADKDITIPSIDDGYLQ
jgi:hypothetical protein